MNEIENKESRKTTIHAHKVLKTIRETFGEEWFEFSELENVIKKTFDNENPMFHNCHDSLFTLPQLVDFFVTKGKLEKENQKLKLTKNVSCEHSH